MTGNMMSKGDQRHPNNAPLLFRPLMLRGVKLRNRIVASPMCQYNSVGGAPTDWHFAHLGRLAIGGAGLVFHEETAVEARGRKTHACAGIWSDEHIPTYRRLADLIRSIGATPGIQLGHAGGKASSHGALRDWAPLTDEDARNGLPPWQPVAPSPVPIGDGRPIPHGLDEAEIRGIVTAWGEAAQRCTQAGFEVLEIHGAHGYLIHQFLSPVTNLRTDGYGGDRKGRMRFALEVAEAVRRAWPADNPLFFRVSCVDGHGGVWDLDDTVVLARELKARGIDVVDCSSGGISGDSSMPIVPRVPGYHVPFARRVRREAAIITVAVGLVTDPQQAEAILARGDADLVALARELLMQADWPVHAARSLGIADYLDLFPTAYAFRLKRRAEIAALEINQPDAPIPTATAELIEST